MSASQGSIVTATALQLLRTLEVYQKDLEGMAVGHFDPELYQRVSTHVDQMRACSAALPQVSVAWVELLIRHFELTHGLWRLGQGTADESEIESLRRAQNQAIEVLRHKCAHVLAQP